jgi:glycosyltransferase involved in cell wall biosynthesis
MRILHVSHQYAPAIGGSERYITDLSEALVRRGHRVDLFTSQSVDYRHWQNVLPARERIHGVNVRRFRSLVRGERTYRLLDSGYRNYWALRSRFFEPAIFFGNGPVMPGLAPAILRHAGAYDLVHINQLHYAHAWPAFLAARLRHLPVVITPHIHIEQPLTYDVGYLWRVLRGSQAVIAVTAAEQTFLQARLPAQTVLLGGNALDLRHFPTYDQGASRAYFGLPADGFVLLFLGRKTEYKGLAHCLAAFQALRRQRTDCYFLAVGPETDHSRQLWAQSGPVAGLIVRDTVSEDERLTALAACDILALPSTGEAFGIVYLEAWAYAKPVIGANIQSVASLIDHGVDGLIVDPAQPSQLQRALHALASDPAWAHQLGAQGRRKLQQQYTIEQITDRIEGAYARVIRRAQTTTEQQGFRRFRRFSS